MVTDMILLPSDTPAAVMWKLEHLMFGQSSVSQLSDFKGFTCSCGFNVWQLSPPVTLLQ